MARSLLVVLDVSIDGDGHRRPSSSSPMRGREVWPVMGSDHFVSAEEMWWALFGVAGGAGRVVRASSSSFVAGRGLRPSGFCEIFPSIKWGKKLSASDGGKDFVVPFLAWSTAGSWTRDSRVVFASKRLCGRDTILKIKL
jgi:hypothetical protein